MSLSVDLESSLLQFVGHAEKGFPWCNARVRGAIGVVTSLPQIHDHYARFRAEKRSAQASAHPLSQAQGGLFCVLTGFVCCLSSE